jgi:hypothetical protein
MHSHRFTHHHCFAQLAASKPPSFPDLPSIAVDHPWIKTRRKPDLSNQLFE